MIATLITTLVQPALLENINTNFEGKKIGYYIGSFDPFHKGHQKHVEQIIEQGLVDYVLVYPVPGGDEYKNRSDFALRKEMIRSACKTNARILTTELSPAKVQEFFTPYIGKIEIIGIIGSDVVEEHLADPDKIHQAKVDKVFMRGLPIPEKHHETTIGAIMALPATAFIVSLRNNADLSHITTYQDRPIRAFVRLEAPYCNFSSTKVREAVRNKTSISEMVAPSVEEIIMKKGLYI